MIVMEKVSKSFGKQLIFDKIDLRIDKCGFYAFVGPSGCGKSTLLSMIAQTEEVSSGLLDVKGKVATIYQDYQLFGELTVEDNITLLKDDVNYLQLCDELNLTALINQYPAELSGGQQQRVGIARAIALDPDIILCDEPTESLDNENKTIVMEYLKKLSADKIVIIVSHDLALIHRYVDVIYEIKNHKLVCQVLHEPSKCMDSPKQEHKLDVKQMIKKLILKNELRIQIVFNLLSLFLIFMFVFSAKIFYVSDSQDVLNIDKLYVNIYDKYGNLDIAHADGLRRIVPFKEAMINDKNYIANIYPVVTNPAFSFKIPIYDEIIINQNLAVDVAIGDPVDLVYESVDGTLEIKTFYVVDIIEEDTTQNNIYYNLATINKVFLEENDKLAIPYDEYIDQMSLVAQLDIDYDDIEKIYADNQNLKDLSIYHPTYELRREIKNNMLIFKVMAYSFQVIYLLGLSLFMILYNYKSNQKALKNYALLLSFGANRKAIKKYHFKYKLYGFMLGYIIFISGCMFLGILFKDYLRNSDILILAIIALIIFGLYLFTLNMALNKLDHANVNTIIKT